MKKLLLNNEEERKACLVENTSKHYTLKRAPAEGGKPLHIEGGIRK